MSDDATNTDQDSLTLDLSGLSDLSLGPDWGSGKKPTGNTPKVRDGDDRRDRRGGARPRDRRGPRPERKPASGGNFDDRQGGDRPRREGGGPRRDQRDRRGFRPEREAPFEPLVEATFYPDDNAFNALAQAIKTSARTFELFEIARLILAKSERYVCLVKHPAQVAGEPALLHACVIDGLPFLSEEEAVTHTFKHYIDQFLDVSEVEVEAPTGNFPMIHKCGVTGTLIGPPNYHRYQKLLEEHHANNVPRMSFERFKDKLETVREQADIDAWLEQMKKQKRYAVKEGLEGVEPAAFDNLESARFHLMTHAKDKLVRPAYSARFEGKDIPKLAERDPIRRSLEALHERQVRFPLDTANNLRSRLRRLNFSIYKRGSKGVSYVCAVKRKARFVGEVMADNLSDLLAFLEDHVNLPSAELPKEYLGLAIPEDGKTDALSPEDKEKLVNLKKDLRYLVTQGYVVEFSDGRLFTAPATEKKAEAPKAKKPEVEKAAKAEAEPASTEQAVPVAEESPAPEAVPAPPAEEVPTPPPAAPEAPVAETPAEPTPVPTEPVAETVAEEAPSPAPAEPVVPDATPPAPPASVAEVPTPEVSPAEPEAAPAEDEKPKATPDAS